MNPKKITALVVGLALVLLVPVFVKENLTMQYIINMLIFAYFATSWNVIGGYAGQMALGNGVYIGIGAYVSTILFAYEGVSPWIGMIIGGIIAALLALLVGRLTFKLNGSYFSLATIALLSIIRLLFICNNYMLGYHTKGALGLRIPWVGRGLADMQFTEKSGYFYIILGLLVVGIAVSYFIKNSKIGYYLSAISTNPEAAGSLGVNVMGMKLIASMISAFMTAVGGTFFVQFISVVDPSRVFGFDMSMEIVLFAIIGGKGTLVGPVLAAFILAPFQDIMRGVMGVSIVGLPEIVYGMLLMLVVFFLPNGIWTAIVKLYNNVNIKGKLKETKSFFIRRNG